MPYWQLAGLLEKLEEDKKRLAVTVTRARSNKWLLAVCAMMTTTLVACSLARGSHSADWIVGFRLWASSNGGPASCNLAHDS